MPTPMRHHIKTRRKIRKVLVPRTIIHFLLARPQTNHVIHISRKTRLVEPPARPNRARNVCKRSIGDAPHVLLARPEACFCVEDLGL